MKIALGIVKHRALSGLVAALTLLAAGTVWSLTPGEQQIVGRIKPVGNVCVEGEACEGAQTSASVAVVSGPRSGADIYGSKCFVCHDTGLVNAPKMGDAADWSVRLEKGIDVIVANAINGIGNMPAKGTCSDCSDEEIASTVEHMLNSSK